MEEGEIYRGQQREKKTVFMFGMTRQWITQTALTALGLTGLGYQVTLGYVPYLHWKKTSNLFDQGRQNQYIKHVLSLMDPPVDVLSLWELQGRSILPKELESMLRASTIRDVKYCLMREDVDPDSKIYKLRYERNHRIAEIVYPLLKENSPDVVIVPNGSVLEFGIVFQIAKHLGIPAVSYEFGEQKRRIWLAKNQDVMRQRTDGLWNVARDIYLSGKELDQIRDLYQARRGAHQWQQFSRQWQKVTSSGGKKIRKKLGLDSRPIVLLPTNVLGDSLTLGREIISESMTEWIVQTIRYFQEDPSYQLIVRIHPGEQLSWGPSVYEILEDYFDDLPDHIHIIHPTAEVNSYDLIELCSLGIVFTTTLGLEMVLSGKPVIVVGETHYREKGFTLDPNSWEDYLLILEQVLAEPEKYQPSEEDINLAWRYAYHFFFNYPFPFPWHVQHFGEDLEEWPLRKVLSREGRQRFEQTFRYLAGEPVNWEKEIQ